MHLLGASEVTGDDPANSRGGKKVVFVLMHRTVDMRSAFQPLCARTPPLRVMYGRPPSRPGDGPGPTAGRLDGGRTSRPGDGPGPTAGRLDGGRTSRPGDGPGPTAGNLTNSPQITGGKPLDLWKTRAGFLRFQSVHSGSPKFFSRFSQPFLTMLLTADNQ